MSTTKPRLATRKYEYAPNYAVAPGETLCEVIENLGMTPKDLATRTGLTEQMIIRIINGEQPLTLETANLLELVTGVPARLWNNLEMQYRERLRKLAPMVREFDLGCGKIKNHKANGFTNCATHSCIFSARVQLVGEGGA